ncbi:cytosolic sulfotransferase 14 [Eucalyptus grandis]|uniref:cytosolic sulfotransferase 14 n=1 Tax=Eucalyptus grandis TaxID=71139 RepID=UPI00192F0F2C|nr:cytosolic sulfotransferase 14 [Eucalyptus grandis]
MAMGDSEQEAIDELIASLPQEKVLNLPPCCLFQNFCYPIFVLPKLVACQRHFKAKDKDIVVASTPKSGTTWLMAIAFSIVNRSRFDVSNTPLLTSSPHELVPRFEFDLFGHNPRVNLDDMEEPRLFATHVAYPSLPSASSVDCRIIYIVEVRWTPWFPLGTSPSRWRDQQSGQSGLWKSISRAIAKESLERPHKVLFLKYEDLKEDIEGQMKKVAQFVGGPFTEEEEEGGVIEEIAKMCSLKTLQNLEVNKSGKLPAGARAEAQVEVLGRGCSRRWFCVVAAGVGAGCKSNGGRARQGAGSASCSQGGGAMAKRRGSSGGRWRWVAAASVSD